MTSIVEFSFRIWVPPKDGDPAEFEVWFQGLEPTESGKRFVSDWAKESLSYEDLHSLFGLDPTKYWQVVGRGTLQGWWDYYGEYDEALDITEFDKAEVPDSWLYGETQTSRTY